MTAVPLFQFFEEEKQPEITDMAFSISIQLLKLPKKEREAICLNALGDKYVLLKDIEEELTDETEETDDSKGSEFYCWIADLINRHNGIKGGDKLEEVYQKFKDRLHLLQ